MKECKIECGENVLRIWLDEEYAIRKLREGKLYTLEYYRFGTNYIPDEIYANEDLFVVYKKYEEVK